MKMMLVAATVLWMAASGCMQFRQQAAGATPAPGMMPTADADSAFCPDMSQGCKKTVWAFAWGVFHTPELDRAECGTVGLAEVTVRSQPLLFLISTLTVGLVTPRRVEWKCKAPAPSEGDTHEHAF